MLPLVAESCAAGQLLYKEAFIQAILNAERKDETSGREQDKQGLQEQQQDDGIEEIKPTAELKVAESGPGEVEQLKKRDPSSGLLRLGAYLARFFE